MTTQLTHTNSMDVTWLLSDPSVWTAVEVNIGIVSGKAPLMSRRSLAFFVIFCTSHHLHLILLTESLACLPSLRPLLVAVMGENKILSGQRRNGSGRPSGVSNASDKTRIIWQKFIRRLTYVREARVGAERSTKDSWQGQGMKESKDVFVRHDVSVIGEQHGS